MWQCWTGVKQAERTHRICSLTITTRSCQTSFALFFSVRSHPQQGKMAAKCSVLVGLGRGLQTPAHGPDPVPPGSFPRVNSICCSTWGIMKTPTIAPKGHRAKPSLSRTPCAKHAWVARPRSGSTQRPLGGVVGVFTCVPGRMVNIWLGYTFTPSIIITCSFKTGDKTRETTEIYFALSLFSLFCCWSDSIHDAKQGLKGKKTSKNVSRIQHLAKTNKA